MPRIAIILTGADFDRKLGEALGEAQASRFVQRAEARYGRRIRTEVIV